MRRGERGEGESCEVRRERGRPRGSINIILQVYLLEGKWNIHINESQQKSTKVNKSQQKSTKVNKSQQESTKVNESQQKSARSTKANNFKY